MIFKSRMIPAGIYNYILVILLSERDQKKKGGRMWVVAVGSVRANNLLEHTHT